MKKLYIFVIGIIFSMTLWSSPSIGTEIWIEPGQTKEQIYNWCELASKSGLNDIRIFIMWTHVEPKKDCWNFDVYDWVFQACEKYDLRLQVTLNPNQPSWFYDRQYWSSIHSHAIFSEIEMKKNAAIYIKKVVERYKNSKALDNWWIMNEPLPGSAATPYFLTLFHNEMIQKYGNIQNLNKAWNSNFQSFDEIDNINDLINKEWASPIPFYDWTKAQNKHLTQFQSWVHDEVIKWDNRHGFHTNPASHLSLFHRQEATTWRPFLNSLGVSIHPTWHFGMFTINQYTLGVSATCALGRSNANPNPFWVSELSGGDNMFRYCPTPYDIAQWTWTSIAQGAEKIIYWLLNTRKKGLESGEWTLLDFQGQSTDRFKIVSSIAKIINKNSFFKTALPVSSRITVILSPETNLTYDRIAANNDLHNMSAISCYKSLLERGISAQIKQINDYDWDNVKGEAVILANVLTINSQLIDSLKKFIKNGNKLIVIGPTGYYDEIENCTFLDFPFKEIFGASPKEVRTLGNNIVLENVCNRYNLPVEKILCTLNNDTATPISTYGKEITGIRKSNVIWIPSCVGVGSWNNGCRELSSFLVNETLDYTQDLPVLFKDYYENVTMQTMKSDKQYLTVINNANNSPMTINLLNPQNLKARILYSTTNEKLNKILDKPIITLDSNECLVLLWN